MDDTTPTSVPAASRRVRPRTHRHLTRRAREEMLNALAAAAAAGDVAAIEALVKLSLDAEERRRAAALAARRAQGTP